MITNLPAMKQIREFYKEDEIHLHNTYPGKNDVHKTLFEHLNLFDKLSFTPVKLSLFASVFQRLKNLYHIRSEKYDIIYDLPGNNLSPKWMFRLFGAKKVVAMDVLEPEGGPRFRFLLNFLAENGIPRRENDESVDWNFQPDEISAAETWFSKLRLPDGYKPFLVCTGGKSPLQHWPLERYAEVLKKIIPEYGLYPVFVGTGSDAVDAEYLINECGTGVFSQDIGPLSLREMILVFKKFHFYLGNDTGILHLAGAAGIRTFSLSPARDPHNYWRPLNDLLHHGFVANIACKECRRNECSKGEKDCCINLISTKELIGYFENGGILKHLTGLNSFH